MTDNLDIKKCIACDSTHIYIKGIQVGYVEGITYDIFVCKECDTSFSSPHKEGEEVYDLIYKHRDDAPGYMRYGVYAKDILKKNNPWKYLSNKEEMYYGLFKAIRGLRQKNLSILDVGCGLGYVSYALHKMRHNVTGLDISNEAITLAKEKYGDYFVCEDFFKIGKNNNKKYDVICMLELIEHVENPSLFIKHAMSLLNESGILIITTPNKSFYPRESIWETDAPPVHITWFSEEGILKLIKRLGYNSRLSSFSLYNLFYGTVYNRPLPSFPTRTSIFSKNGEPLYSRYKKSNIRIITEKYHIYSFIKGFVNVIKKCKDIIKLMFHPSFYTGSKSNIMCIVVSKHS